MSKKQLVIIDPGTGAVVNYLKENDQIIRAESRKSYQENKKKQKERVMDFINRGLFVRVLHNKDREIEKELSLTQSDVLQELFLCVTIDSKNYLVHIDGEKKGQKMNLTDISMFLSKSERQTKRDLTAIVKIGALISEQNPKKKTENYYLLNSEFFSATKNQGSKVNFTKMFLSKLKEVRSKLNKNQRGALLKFIRNFHYQTYYLVANPNHNIIINPELSISDNLLLEENKFVLKHLNQRKLALIIGVGEEAVRGYVEAYEKAGAMMVHRQHKSYRFIIHPDLMFRKDYEGEDEYTKTIRFQFKQLENNEKKPQKKKCI
ncbi:hypothetical protein QUF86_08665 [Peribacillus sp. NJ11]|uniref:hypothetical protein n=1 Tax=Peribacillus sp. NJ11 TaxID=3055861 RepID=UPI0025A0BB14|nr:hypothetical protein [Peribacillus sp. NJ11]MDM5220820.1 hypothetical protein [Peribacillus sp. NJ11]